MAIGDTNEPVGAPSLSEQEIIFLYQKYLGRPPDSGELASEKENALKYAAAGIERQIALRAGNVAASGVRGDEGLPALTVPYVPPLALHPAVIGNVITMGASAIPGGVPGDTYATYAGGPTGLVAPYTSPSPYALAGGGGLSMSTLLILAGAAVALYFLIVRR